MLKAIEKMIDTVIAPDDVNYDLLDSISDMIYSLATTFNAPSDWREIPGKLARKYKGTEIYNYLELYNYTEVEEDD